jgi:hypothetical protein
VLELSHRIIVILHVRSRAAATVGHRRPDSSTESRMLSSLCCFFSRGGRFSIGLRPKIGLKEVESRCVGGELAAEWADFGGERGIAIAVQSMLAARVVCFMRPRIDGPRPQRQALRHRSLGQAANDWARYRLGRQQQTVDDITGRGLLLLWGRRRCAAARRDQQCMQQYAYRADPSSR